MKVPGDYNKNTGVFVPGPHCEDHRHALQGDVVLTFTTRGGLVTDIAGVPVYMLIWGDTPKAAARIAAKPAGAL